MPRKWLFKSTERHPNARHWDLGDREEAVDRQMISSVSLEGFNPPAQKCQHLLPVQQSAKPTPLCLLQTLYIPHPPQHSWVNPVNHFLSCIRGRGKDLVEQSRCCREGTKLTCPCFQDITKIPVQLKRCLKSL